MPIAALRIQAASSPVAAADRVAKTEEGGVRGDARAQAPAVGEHVDEMQGRGLELDPRPLTLAPAEEVPLEAQVACLIIVGGWMPEGFGIEAKCDIS